MARWSDSDFWGGFTAAGYLEDVSRVTPGTSCYRAAACHTGQAAMLSTTDPHPRLVDYIAHVEGELRARPLGTQGVNLSAPTWHYLTLQFHQGELRAWLPRMGEPIPLRECGAVYQVLGLQGLDKLIAQNEITYHDIATIDFAFEEALVALSRLAGLPK